MLEQHIRCVAEYSAQAIIHQQPLRIQANMGHANRCMGEGHAESMVADSTDLHRAWSSKRRSRHSLTRHRDLLLGSPAAWPIAEPVGTPDSTSPIRTMQGSQGKAHMPWTKTHPQHPLIVIRGMSCMQDVAVTRSPMAPHQLCGEQRAGAVREHAHVVIRLRREPAWSRLCRYMAPRVPVRVGHTHSDMAYSLAQHGTWIDCYALPHG